MKSIITSLLLVLGTALCLSSCTRNLKSESGLYDVPLTHTYKAAVDGFWVNEGKSKFAHQKTGTIYLAPLNVDIMMKENADKAPLLKEQMHDHLVKAFQSNIIQLNKNNQSNWHLTENKSQSDITVELAVVKFRTQHPIMKVISSIGGFFINIPGVSTVAGEIAAGNIGVEGVMRDSKTGKVLLAFKDANRKTTRLYHKAAYDSMGQADQNLQFWSERLAKVLSVIHFNADGTNNLNQLIKDRSFGDVISNKIDEEI